MEILREFLRPLDKEECYHCREEKKCVVEITIFDDGSEEGLRSSGSPECAVCRIASKIQDKFEEPFGGVDGVDLDERIDEVIESLEKYDEQVLHAFLKGVGHRMEF